MKGLPRAIVLGLLSSFAGEGKEQPVPSGPRHGHQPIGSGIAKLWRNSGSEMHLPTETVCPGLKYEGNGESGAHSPWGLPLCLLGSAQTARLWCRVWFQDKLPMPPRAPC